MAIKGTFEFIEEKIRRSAKGTEFGKDFEWLCKWYLENAPQYRGKFRKVYLWNEWPDRWGADCGIDLIAETHSGDLWAIQSKAVSEDHTLTKREIDSFLAESSRKQIKYRLLIASTDKVGPNARRTIEQQEKQASLLLRGDLLTTDIVWPEKVGGKAPKPVRAKPRPHQKAAINDVKRGFKKHSKGQLIMACGTGKTLTGLWIKEALKTQRTLLLVPSISLVQQNLSEWGRHANYYQPVIMTSLWQFAVLRFTGDHMELKQDIFSSFCTGQHLVDKQNHKRYESTPGYVFDTLCQELGFMTLAKIDEKTSSFVYALHSPEIIWGFIRMDMPRLNPLDVLTSQSHTRHIWQVSTREDMRGWGFFKTAMGAIVEAAEEAGIFLHGISSPFFLKWPDIDTAEQFLWFIENENKFFGEQKSWKEQKNQSRKLLKKYQEFGFCKFRYPQGNGFRNRWKRNNSGFGYMPSECDETVKESLEDYLRC